MQSFTITEVESCAVPIKENKDKEAPAMEDYWYVYIILLLLETDAAKTHSVSSSRSYLRAKIIKWSKTQIFSVCIIFKWVEEYMQ